MVSGTPTHADTTVPYQRKDWRHLPYSPGLKCLQALSLSGKTASGAGFTRSDAYLRCMGELAEIAALEAHPPPDCLVRSPVPSWQGIAADEDATVARGRALCEALERAATDLWWQGRCPAVEIDMKHGDGGLLAQDLYSLRGPAGVERETVLFALPHFPMLHVSLAISSSKSDSRIVFGFGAQACAYASARSALLEMAMMELNLTDILSGSGQADRLTRLSGDFRARQRVLFEAGVQQVRRDGAPSLESFAETERKLGSIGVSVDYQNLPIPNSKLSVWRAVLVGSNGLGTPTPKDQRPLL